MGVLRKTFITLFVAMFAAAPLQLRAQDTDWKTPANFGSTEWAVANWDRAVDYVKYIAEGNDQEKLKSVPGNLRAEAWQEFWKGSDPVSSTDVNEYRKEYFRRIGYANEHFTTPLRKGWITDRGEAYVRLGEPRYVEKLTMRRSGRDIHVWQYPTEHGLELVFVDRTGVGNFYLANPTAMIDEVYMRN